MGVKNVIMAAGILLAAGSTFGNTVDSVGQKKALNVKIGPSFFDARIVDSALLRKRFILGLLRKKNSESMEMQRYRDLRTLKTLLTNTEVWASPDERVVAQLNPLLEKYETDKDLKGQALVLNTYAVFYGRKSEWDKSTRYFSEALALKERLGDKASMVRINRNLEALAIAANEPDKALAYTRRLIELHRSMGHTVAAADSYLTMASSQLSAGDFKDAEVTVLKKALPMFTRMGNKEGRLRCFDLVASIYLRQKLYSEAKWFYVQAHVLAKRLDNREAVVNSLCKLAEVKTAEGYHEMALDDFHEAELLARTNNLNEKLIEIKAEMGEVYSLMGDYMAAGNVLAEYSRLRENLMKSAVL